MVKSEYVAFTMLQLLLFQSWDICGLVLDIV